MRNRSNFCLERWWWLLMSPMVASAWVRDLWAPDEPRYAEVAREVYEGSSFVVMHLCSQVYPDKPPLLFWLSGFFGWLSNWSEFWMRFPSLAATFGSALLVGRLARRWWGPRAAPWASAIFLSTAMVTEIGGRLQIDPLLTFLCILSLELVLRPSRTKGQRARHLLAAALCVGLGGLAKGPAALANVGLVLLAWRVFGPREEQPKVGWPVWLAAAVLTVGPVVGWTLLAVAQEPGLAGELFFNQHVGRITKADRHPGPIWKHLIRFPLLLLPWTGAVFGGLRTGFRALTRGDDTKPARSFIPGFLWVAVLVLFYSIIPPKRDLYLLLAYPAAALVGAAYLVSRFDGRRVSNWVTLPGPLLFIVVGMVTTAAPWFTNELPDLSWHGPVVGLAAVAGGIWTMAALHQRGLRAWASSLVVVWSIVSTLIAFTLFQLANPIKSARGIAGVIAARPERPSEIPCVGVRPEGYRFYGNGAVPATTGGDLAPVLAREGDDFLALVRRERWLEIAPSFANRLFVIAEYRVGNKRMVLVGSSQAHANR